MAYLATSGNMMLDRMNAALAPKKESWLDKLGSGAASLFGKAKSAMDKASPEQRAEWLSGGQAGAERAGGATYVASQPSAGISTTHILIGGAALVGLFLVLKKK